MKKYTASGDYKLPGGIESRFKTSLVHLAQYAPRVVRRWFCRRHNYYQRGASGGVTGQGAPEKKFEAMTLPSEMNGLSVLDIGCAEGFFSRECAKRGAGQVIGIDANFASVLCAAFLAKDQSADVEYRVGSFPYPGLTKQFDLVFCLSVLHHMVSTKDIWALLNDEVYKSDLLILRTLLVELRERTVVGGFCIIEMPYEPMTDSSRDGVDFDRFSEELMMAGFSAASRIGSWDFDESCSDRKERQIYRAQR